MYLLFICFVWSVLQDQAVAFEDLKKTMETTRAHLQNQLRSKEMECGRLSVQIRVRIYLIYLLSSSITDVKTVLEIKCCSRILKYWPASKLFFGGYRQESRAPGTREETKRRNMAFSRGLLRPTFKLESLVAGYEIPVIESRFCLEAYFMLACVFRP